MQKRLPAPDEAGLCVDNGQNSMSTEVYITINKMNIS